MTLKLKGRVITRYVVEQIAKDIAFIGGADVAEVDLSEAEVIGSSTMHQIILSFPDAHITGLEGYNGEIYEWVLQSINSDEFKRNQGGGA